MKKIVLYTLAIYLTIGVIIINTESAAQKNLLNIRDKTACEAAGGVWTVNPLFPCTAKTPGENILPSVPAVPIPGPLPLPPKPVTEEPTLEEMKETFLAWASKTHWAKRRTEIAPQVATIESIMPPGSPKIFIIVQFGELSFLGDIDLFNKMVIVSGGTPKDMLITIPEEKKREIAARILYYLSME